PFIGNANAPATSVGIFAGDACNFFGSACALGATTLIAFDQAVQAGTSPGTQVAQNSVRYIINASTAQSGFGTPFGGPLNLCQDAVTNIANLGLFKNIKMTERDSLEFKATLQNVFNHANFQSIDPNIEDVGLAKNQQAPFVGFGDPSVSNDVLGNALGARIVRFGLTFRY